MSLRRKVGDALANLVPDRADRFNRLAFRIRKRPIEFFQERHIRASIAAPHGDEQRSLSRQILRKELRFGAGQIDPFLSHDLNDLRVNALPRLRARRYGSRLRAVAHLVEPGRSHLGSSGIVDAGKQYGVQGMNPFVLRESDVSCPFLPT